MPGRFGRKIAIPPGWSNEKVQVASGLGGTKYANLVRLPVADQGTVDEGENSWIECRRVR